MDVVALQLKVSAQCARLWLAADICTSFASPIVLSILRGGGDGLTVDFHGEAWLKLD